MLSVPECNRAITQARCLKTPCRADSLLLVRMTQLGSTGLQVSDLGLGTMTWGRDTDDHDAAEQLEMFIAAGGTFVDTASSFAGGLAQEIVGSLLASFAGHDIVVSAKSGGVADAERPFNNSRRWLLTDLAHTLQRLSVDRVDIWTVTGFDPYTPVTETLDTLAQAVTSGDAAYVGICNWPDTWVAHAVSYLQTVHRMPLACVQAEYSLVNRSAERLLIPYLDQQAVSLVAWSALGRGTLTGKYRFGTPADSRAASAHLRDFVGPYLGGDSATVVEAVCAAADGLAVSPIDVALAWLRARTSVACALLGARTSAQLRGILNGAVIDLPRELIDALDEVSNSAKHREESA